jgi:hypothetical protein
MSAQKPMKVRMQEVMELLWKRNYLYADRIENSVLKKLINRKMVKRDITGIGFGTKTTTIIVPLIPNPNVKEEVDTGGPFAKRRAALEESELHYRGKNLGRPKVVGERKLTKRQQREKAKKAMWEKLKSN